MGGDRLDGLSLCDLLQEVFLDSGESGVGCHRRGQSVNDLGVEHRTTSSDFANCPGQLITLSDAVFEQVGISGRTLSEESHCVFGVVVLRQDHDPGARVALADLDGGVDAFSLVAGRHANVCHDHLGLGSISTGHQLVVICADSDDVEVVFEIEQGLHALPNDQVVVSKKDRDHRLSNLSPVTVSEKPDPCHRDSHPFGVR